MLSFTIADPAEQHQYCRCLYQIDPSSFENKSYNIDRAVFDEIKSLFIQCTIDSILKELLPGYKININESFNHVLRTYISTISRDHNLEIDTIDACSCLSPPISIAINAKVPNPLQWSPFHMFRLIVVLMSNFLIY